MWLPHRFFIWYKFYVGPTYDRIWIFQNRGSFHDCDVKKSVESHTVLNLRRFYVWESKKSLWESHEFLRFRKNRHVCTRRWQSDPQNVALLSHATQKKPGETLIFWSKKFQDPTEKILPKKYLCAMSHEISPVSILTYHTTAHQVRGSLWFRARYEEKRVQGLTRIH